MQSTFPSNSRHKKNHKLTRSLVATILLLGLSLLIALNRQLILDYIDFATYKPDGVMSAIVQRAGLNNTGKFIFYATQPEIEEGAQFNKKCARLEEGTAVLGCYMSDKIYIYNVKDSRLDGIKEVTAAHEMLHAVYQRMSDAERKKVNDLVEAEYAKLSTNPRFADRMAFYARTEPGERDNELHSIIGTEVGGINPELEIHYAKYFVDRSRILDLFNGYNSVFVEIEARAKSLSDQLDLLSTKIDAEMNDYNGKVKKLNKDIDDFNRRAASGAFSSQASFSSERQTLVERADAVTAQRTRIDADLQRYEELRRQYNEIVTASNNLYKSIDSSLAPAPSV